MTNGNDAIEWIEKNEGDLAQSFFEEFQHDEIVECLIQNKPEEWEKFCHDQWLESNGE